MKRETALWRDRARDLFQGLDPVRVENIVDVGTPDVNCTLGWVELKCLARWPARASTVVRVPHYTPEQRVWATRRALAGGRVFLLLVIDEDWMLFDGRTAAQYVGHVMRKQLTMLALCAWKTKPTREEFQACLRH